MSIWIFSNNKVGYNQDSDWDTSTILKHKRYYFKSNEPNRTKVASGDRVVLREYGTGIWGVCEVAGDWVDDPEAKTKHEIEAGWFPIAKLQKWDTTLPYELVKEDLSNQNYRLRIAKATEEAVKANLKQLRLRLADESIQQQCSLGIGIGRTDLICLDERDDFVVLELKAVHSSDSVVGQLLRYMGYIRENWAEKAGKKVRGIILTPSYDEQLRLAAKEAGIQVLRVRIP